MLFPSTLLAVEEKGKLDNLYLTLPITRKTIVKTRYSLSLIMQFSGLLFGTISTVLLSFILNGKKILYLHTFYSRFSKYFAACLRQFIHICCYESYNVSDIIQNGVYKG
ncbi:MAG: ABC-2 transporter permease [Eubacteriales bacterium]